MSERKPSILREKPSPAGHLSGAEPGLAASVQTDDASPSRMRQADPSDSDPSSHSTRAPAYHNGDDRREFARDRGQRPTFYVAGFWHRLTAAAIDLAIIIPVSMLMAWLAGTISGVQLPASRHRGIDFWLDLVLASDPALLGITVITLAIAAVYVLVFQMSLARTPGMRVMKLRIIDQYGEQPSTTRVAARTSGYLASLLTLGLGFVWIGFDSEKRGLHDWIAGTYVVKAR